MPTTRAEMLAVRHKINEEIDWHRLRLKDETNDREKLRTQGIICGLRTALSYFPDRWIYQHYPLDKEG